ncbi:hypothetical protein B0T26DRAFT_704559, partial [Lasiosphaeria miniovina]
MCCRRGFHFLSGRPRFAWPRNQPIIVQRTGPKFVPHSWCLTINTFMPSFPLASRMLINGKNAALKF